MSMFDKGGPLVPGLGAGIKGSASGGPGQTGSIPFMTPWLDYASISVPESHDLVMWWAQYMWLTDGNYRTSMERVAAHFMTTIEFPDLEPGEESVWRDLFNNDLNYRSDLMSVAYDYLAYGNVFLSIYLPFKRFVRCQKCGLEQPIDRVNYRLELTNKAPYVLWHRVSPCPKCGTMSDFDVVDRRDSDISRIRLNRYSPQEIEMGVNRFSLRKHIYWNIPADVRRDIQSGARIHVDDTPVEVLEAVASGGKLRFNEDMIFHQGEPTISGVNTRGWGIPRSIANFRTAWLQQLVNKTDQAVAIDYTLGLRILSPKVTSGSQDPMITHGAQEFTTHMQQIVQTHRNNPTTYHTAPYPVEYQFLGGEGGALMPPDKLKFRHQEYLNQLGIPLEYHQMSLSVQAAPMALRLFESYWQVIPGTYNRVLDWMVSLLGRVYGLDPTLVRMQKTTVADDMERKHVLLQLMSGNQISPQTALQPFGIEAHDEVKKVMRHMAYVEEQQRAQEERDMARQEMGALKGLTAQPTPSMLLEQQMAQQGGDPMAQGMMGQATAGGAPMGGMPGVDANPTSLAAISEQAMMIAQQLVGMDEHTRRQELRALREGNKDLHALVRQNMDQIRSQARVVREDKCFSQKV